MLVLESTPKQNYKITIQFISVCFDLFYHLKLFCRTIQCCKCKKLIFWSQIHVIRKALQNCFFASKTSRKVLRAMHFFYKQLALRLRAQPSGNKQQHKITDYRKSFCERLLRSESEFKNFTLSVKPTLFSNSPPPPLSLM